MKTYIKNIIKGTALLSIASVFTGCSDSFLEQDPLSFYEPKATYSTESGLRAALAICDRHLQYLVIMDQNTNNIAMSSVYLMTDLGTYGKSDAGTGFLDDWDSRLTPTSGMNGGGDGNYMMKIYDEEWNGIKYANTVLNYIDAVEGLDDKTRDAYKGRAYFHRAIRYYHMSLLFGNLPLITKIISVPKQNYRSSSMDAIFKMLVHDLEFAVQHVPAKKDLEMVGMVNQEACMQLLIKCYLAIGEYKKAEDMATDLINNHGLALMQAPFGQDIKAGEPKTWNVQRNVMWDLFRGENVVNSANTEMIMPILNFNDQNFGGWKVMRATGPFWNSGSIKDPSNSAGTPVQNYARNNGNYNAQLDWVRTIGRGIGTFRTSWWFNKGMWSYDGTVDYQDLRHNRSMGNWIEMEDLKYNNPASKHYGENLTLYAPKDVPNPDKPGEYLVKKGDLLCSDTIRSWYPFMLYKNYFLDAEAEQNPGATQFNGVSKGTNGNLYLFRLAETYLLRAEAKFYQGRAGEAAQDLNIVRRRANAAKMLSTATIGDICDERARELFFEEWRQPELTRISWCLARSGRPDEWGNTYDLNTWNKQEGTDRTGGSYWYQRCIHYNIYNRTDVEHTYSNNRAFNFKLNKRNLFWPVPNGTITANNKEKLMQNYGYDGYDASVQMWDNWEDAVADELRGS